MYNYAYPYPIYTTGNNNNNDSVNNGWWAIFIIIIIIFFLFWGFGNNNGNNLQPLYVGTLIADEKGLKELERKMQIIRIKEEKR